MSGLGERLRAALGGERPFELWKVGADPEARARLIEAAYTEPARRPRPQGFRPDGTPVSAQEKQAAYALYEAKLAEFHARTGHRVPVSAAFEAPRDGAPPVPPGRTCAWW